VTPTVRSVADPGRAPTPPPDSPRADGPEFSPDGAFIHFNSEHGAASPAMPSSSDAVPDGSDWTRLTSDERVNWFPHPSPDGRHILYVSFPPGTQGHPADREVVLRRIGPGRRRPRDIRTLFGGQGTLNVNSWPRPPPLRLRRLPALLTRGRRGGAGRASPCPTDPAVPAATG